MTFDELIAMHAKGDARPGATYRNTQSTPEASLAASIVQEVDTMRFDTLEDVITEAEVRGILYPALSNGRDPLCLILEAEEQGHFSFHDYIIGA